MMVNGLVAVTQAGLILLLGMLGLRMFSLIRQESTHQVGVMASGDPVSPPQPKVQQRPIRRKQQTPDYASSDKTELYTRLHILAGLQERDCRVKGLMLSGAPETVRSCAAAWLYGAACAFTPRHQRHTEALAGIVARIISRKTGSGQPEAVQAISTLTTSNLLLACYRAGLEGAEFWQDHQYVPASSSLYEVVTSNAFI
ncbi:hypothetical protein [Marinobacter halophilus]|uniref:Uncharacterized protein n=1 Tax=Marinobacter halophilus TaxID=1323740 RepID=A0A2T1K9T9_9GAMM|nr:hypothetical protein [Marinobacter halophilus]PSF06312.1 hypothetical protein C7H08_14420 [Marinobacter halophilus]GGC71517.1 hypothetical protein GCM10011362_20020 [Marinobacter halophilus]